MAHIKSGGATAQGINVAGKRRGVKKYGGEKVKSGNIIVRQKGTVFYPGDGVKMGRDFTIYSIMEGVVSFRRMTGPRRGKYYVEVIKATPTKQPKMKAKTKSAKKEA